jgi:hypothetical protein
MAVGEEKRQEIRLLWIMHGLNLIPLSSREFGFVFAEKI